MDYWKESSWIPILVSKIIHYCTHNIHWSPTIILIIFHFIIKYLVNLSKFATLMGSFHIKFPNYFNYRFEGTEIYFSTQKEVFWEVFLGESATNGGEYKMALNSKARYVPFHCHMNYVKALPRGAEPKGYKWSHKAEGASLEWLRSMVAWGQLNNAAWHMTKEEEE